MFLSFHLPFCSLVLLFLELWFNIMFMIMGGQLDGLLSHWQPAFANKLIDWLIRHLLRPAYADISTSDRRRANVAVTSVYAHGVYIYTAWMAVVGWQRRSTSMQRSTKHVDCHWHQQFFVSCLWADLRRTCLNLRQLDPADHQHLRVTFCVWWPKKLASFVVRLNFTDFQNYFTVRIRRKFVITLSLKVPPHLKCVATKWCQFFGPPCIWVVHVHSA